MSNQYKVSTLPPTHAIKDTDTRMYLDALANILDQRSGNTDAQSPERFITAREFDSMARQAVVSTLSTGVGGIIGIQPPGESIQSVLGSISDYINRSVLYRLLGTEFADLDVGALSNRLESVFGDAKALVARETNIRQTEYSTTIETFVAQAARIGNAEAAATTEVTTRSNADNSLASAINNIWSKIGGSSAVISDGALAAVSPSGAQATKWDQVQVAVTDPNTGQVSTTSIRAEINSYSSKADGTLNSIYSVRAQVTQGGKTIVGGFGLAAIAGAGSGQGPTIEFGVRADTFFVASISSNDDVKPFTVFTTPTEVAPGVIRQPGVYITDAVIGNAAVDTLRIRGNAVTVPVVASTGGDGASASIFMEQPGTVLAIGTINFLAAVGSNATVSASINGAGDVGISLQGGFSGAITTGYGFSVDAGWHTFSVNYSKPANYSIGSSSIVLMGAMR